MKKWILSALLAGFVVTLASCGCEREENRNRGCRTCKPRCATVVEKLDVNNV